MVPSRHRLGMEASAERKALCECLASGRRRQRLRRVQPPSCAVRSTAHGVTHTSSLLINPAVEASADDAAGNETRRVGVRYLAQQLLTCGPLVIVDLLLLIAVIVIARQTLFSSA